MILLLVKHIEKLAESYQKFVYSEDIDNHFLKSRGIEAVILDHDGLLSGFRDPKPDSEGIRMLNMLIKDYGKNRLFVLSNSLSMKRERASYFLKNFPTVKYIEAANKPNIEGLLIAENLSATKREKIAVIDDGISTGILMAIVGGAYPIYSKRRGDLHESFKHRLLRLATTLPSIFLVRLLFFFRKICHLIDNKFKLS